MDDPRLGRLDYDAERAGWKGWLTLPRFATLGSALESAPGRGYYRARSGRFPLLLVDRQRVGVAPEQHRAVEHLLTREADVLAEVLNALSRSEEAEGLDPQAETFCTGVKVSDLHVGGLAYIGFHFGAACHLEHGLSVVYHPTRGAFGDDDEGLNHITAADNLPRGP